MIFSISFLHGQSCQELLDNCAEDLTSLRQEKTLELQSQKDSFGATILALNKEVKKLNGQLAKKKLEVENNNCQENIESLNKSLNLARDSLVIALADSKSSVKDTYNIPSSNPTRHANTSRKNYIAFHPTTIFFNGDSKPINSVIHTINFEKEQSDPILNYNDSKVIEDLCWLLKMYNHKKIKLKIKVNVLCSHSSSGDRRQFAEKVNAALKNIIEYDYNIPSKRIIYSPVDHLDNKRNQFTGLTFSLTNKKR
jgi:hypothetical protein